MTEVAPDTPPALTDATNVYLDAETNGLRWFAGDRPVGFAVRANGRSHYLPFAHKGGGNLSEDLVRRWAQRELRGKHIVNLNTRFDAHMMRAWGVDLAAQGCTFRDVGHTAALLDDWLRDFSLDGLAQKELGVGKIDLPFKKDEIGDVPAWVVADYAKRDVELVERLHHHYEPLLAAQDLGRVQTLEDRVIAVVVEMEHNGCPIDEPLLHAWLESSERTLENYLWEISRRVGFQVNPDKASDLKRVWDVLHLGVRFRTNTGEASFTEAAMRTAMSEDPTGVVALIHKAGKLIDLRNKFLVPYSKHLVNGHLYCTFHQLMTGEGGTVSGRFSCARPNLQQVMKPNKQKKAYGDFEGETYIVKQLFKAPAQRVWFCADQEQVEFRLFGHYAKAPRILSAYAENPRADFHQVVTDLVRTKNPDMDRDQCKNANFARVYGSGVSKFAQMVGVTDAQAKDILRDYDGMFPEARELLTQATRVAEQRGFVRTLFGRRSRFPNRERTHKALNAVIQGSAADLNKLTLCEVYDRRKELDLTMRLTVHDELDGDTESPEAAKKVVEVLNHQWVPLSVPILWACNTGQTWAEAK